MNNDMRIAAAEFVGWRSERVEGNAAWLSPQGKRFPVGSIVLENPFDPFTDANDDYAVLVKMRAQRKTNVKMWRKFQHQLSVSGLVPISGLKENYQIGDYARAWWTIKQQENDGE